VAVRVSAYLALRALAQKWPPLPTIPEIADKLATENLLLTRATMLA
jgi:hypothetical protein